MFPDICSLTRLHPHYLCSVLEILCSVVTSLLALLAVGVCFSLAQVLWLFCFCWNTFSSRSVYLSCAHFFHVHVFVQFMMLLPIKIPTSLHGLHDLLLFVFFCLGVFFVPCNYHLLIYNRNIFLI